MNGYLVGVISKLKKPVEGNPPAFLKENITDEDLKANKENSEFAIIDLEKKLIKGEDGDNWYPLQLIRRISKETLEKVAAEEKYIFIDMNDATYFNPVNNKWLSFSAEKTESK